MTTMSGIVAVNRAVFGEPGPEPAHVQRLGRTPPDTHLRQLCASCHVGQRKVALGPNVEDARGGGCNACHLAYSPEAAAALVRYEAGKMRGASEAPVVHPRCRWTSTTCSASAATAGQDGFQRATRAGTRCTSRPPEPPTPRGRRPSRFRVLEDERVFERVMPDIHQERGLDCIDCHTSNEAMGDGVAHARKSGQLRVTCEDCHAAPGTALPSVSALRIDPESRKILAVRAWPAPAATEHGRARTGEVLVNVVNGPDGAMVLVRKRTGERRELKAAAPICVEGRGHARLSCGSCHTSWAPRCPTCHTSFDPAGEAYDWLDDAYARGEWKEEAGPFAASLPTLASAASRPLPGAKGGRWWRRLRRAWS